MSCNSLVQRISRTFRDITGGHFWAKKNFKSAGCNIFFSRVFFKIATTSLIFGVRMSYTPNFTDNSLEFCMLVLFSPNQLF